MDTVMLHAIDGLAVRAFVARPEGDPKGCVVVAQEIFGVNDHIRWVIAEQYARAGYLAVAPAFFDRIEPDVELGYTPEGTARGRALVDALGLDAPLRDIRAAAQQIGHGLPVGVVGYCWGGTVAYLAATRLGLPAVGYYGGRTAPFLHERLQAPAMLHFGEHDKLITMDTVRRISTAHPALPCHVYPAGHGFNRFGHPDWHAESADTALARTLAFFRQHLTHD
ncbi:MAG: dienelactone hydrolase family protein [Burkholderiales bacterium]|nr:MAG: dienelactone hydrolase family protein [Burkholderiales bacterium]